jgi:hypothetical protein
LICRSEGIFDFGFWILDWNENQMSLSEVKFLLFNQTNPKSKIKNQKSK